MAVRQRLQGAFAVAPCALLALACAGDPSPSAGRAEGGQDKAGPAFLNMAPEVRYVGQEACRQCHFEQFATYAGTGMGRSFYPMTPAEAVEDFADDNVLVIEESGLHYRMLERDGKFYQRQYLLDSQGREVAVDERELAYVLGSNHHSRSYVIVENDHLFQAPVCWYPDEELWELCPGYEFKNDHFAREISQGCVHCHNGVMSLVEGERNKYEKPYPHGIGCERCHGPGELHVERWRDGSEVPTGEADPTIVHVRRLPPAERIEVCFQCHLGDAKASERVIRHDVEVASFRPGQRITEAVIPFRYGQQTLHDFGLSAQADRLLQSRCYRESGGKLECLTCHNPHVSVYSEDRPPDFFRVKCLGCHAVEACTAAPEAREATEPGPDDCVACHMRVAEPDDQRFTTFTDHWIRRDIDVRERDHRERFDVEPVFPERAAELGPGQLAFYEAQALSLLSEDAPASKRREMWTRAEGSLLRAIDEGFDAVESRYLLGKVQSYLGKDRESEASYQRGYEHDRTHANNAFALGQALAQRGELDRALAIFEEMLERDPRSTMALAEAGRLVGLQGRPEEALPYFERAIAREPWNPTLHVNAGKLLAQMGRFGEAADRAADAVRLNPDEPRVWEFYEKAHDAADRPEQAAEARHVVARLTRDSG
jgi:tetratricopeptide (TPR) repeat protein